MSVESRLVNVDKLKARIAKEISLSEIAERLCDLELARSGKQYKTLCPLHQEDTPSFYVSDEKGLYHCFGCHASGDGIQLVREIHHVGFNEALTMLAEEAGINIEEYTRPATPEEKERDALRGWCEYWLRGCTLLTGDRISLDVAGEYEVGMATAPIDPPNYFADKSYLFQGIIFPYRSLDGRLVGWKARYPDKKMFMTPVGFPLTRPAVFGLNVARPYIEDGKLVIVEGEFDCLALADHGVRNVGAIGGSKWTDEQMAVLQDARIREVVFWLDGDESGQIAAQSIAERFWKHEIRVRILWTPSEVDPEDVARMGINLQAWISEQAKDALEWLLWQEYQKESRHTMGSRLAFVRWIQEKYGSQLTEVQAEVVLREVANWLGVDAAEVLDFVRTEKTLLQVPDSEKVVLGKAIRDQAYYVILRKRMARDDFFLTKHRRIWQVLEQLLLEGLQSELVTIKSHAANQGVSPEYVELLAQTGDLNIGWHEDQVIDFSVRRSAQADADRFREVIADVSLPANQLIGGLTHTITQKVLGRGSGAFRPIQEQVDEAMETLHRRMQNPNAVHGIDLGSQLPQLTQSLQGLQPRRLVLLTATSGVGKSSMTLQWVTGLAIHQAIPTDFISLEMDSDEILFKQCAHLTGIDSLKITSGSLDEKEVVKVEQAMAKIRRSPFRVYAPDGLTPSEFVLYARESVMERRTEVFVVDYAQMVSPDPAFVGRSRYEQLGEFGYTAKLKVARALDVTVVCCGQLKREAAGKDRPTMEDIGDSYELARASDVFLILSVQEDHDHLLWIDKNRQGANNILVPLHFDGAASTFRETGTPKLPDYAVL